MCCGLRVDAAASGCRQRIFGKRTLLRTVAAWCGRGEAGEAAAVGTQSLGGDVHTRNR